MANASHDDNGVPTKLGTLTTDGVTPQPIAVNPSNKAVKVNNGTTGTASTRTVAPRDANDVPTWLGVSSVDGVTLVPIAVDSNGLLQVQST